MEFLASYKKILWINVVLRTGASAAINVVLRTKKALVYFKRQAPTKLCITTSVLTVIHRRVVHNCNIYPQHVNKIWKGAPKVHFMSSILHNDVLNTTHIRPQNCIYVLNTTSKNQGIPRDDRHFDATLCYFYVIYTQFSYRLATINKCAKKVDMSSKLHHVLLRTLLIPLR